MNEQITTLTQAIIFQNSHSAYEIAKHINKPYPTLMRECNPHDKGAKLGASTLFEIMKFTQNVEPLRFMAHALGYEVVKIKDNS
jgi:hypothetical protein